MVRPDGYLLANLPAKPQADELTAELVARPGVRIERIVSTGQSSPPGFWYDQPDDEWVTLLAGAARLEFDGGAKLELKPGEYILIAAHRRHRIDWTDPQRPTVWLAVHLPPATAS